MPEEAVTYMRPVKKARLLLLLGVLVATLMSFASPVAFASVTANPASAPHPVRLAYGSTVRPDDLSTNLFCQTSDTNECLNVQNCNIYAGVVQLYDWTTGYGCSEGFSATYEGTVDPSNTWPFYCGDGLNSAYDGDHVFYVQYYGVDNSTTIFTAPNSSGYNDPVTLGIVPPGYSGPIGLWVQQDNNGPSTVTDTRLIDVSTTCSTGHVQHVYAGCGGNGCLVREGENPSSDNYWNWVTGDYP
jgi:hypothetical protein